MRKILFSMLLLLVMTTVANAAMSYGLSYYITRRGQVGAGNPADPLYQFINEVEGIIEDATLDDGNVITFDNGLTIDNSTDNALEFNENSEELILTFSNNSLAWTSGTGVVTMTFGSIIPNANQFIVTPVA
ncbi:MAG: hypothetical protein ACYS21_14115, partial [Planctomycetota bacterium]